MTAVVHKFGLQLGDTVVTMALGAKPLSLGWQDDERLVMWALIPLHTERLSLRVFRVVATGNVFPDDAPHVYIGTSTSRTGFVAHLFEITQVARLPAVRV